MSEYRANPGVGGKFRIPLAQRTFWQGAFGHLGLSETQRFLVLALLIGMFSGLLVVLFHISIDVISWSTLGALAGRFHLVRLLTPGLGAVGAVLVVRKLFPRARGSGVNQTKIAIYSSDGYVSSSTIFGKFLACAVSIGTGNSLGPEDPSLQMGAGVASWLGRLFHLPRNNMRLIAPVGAAAGIAAAFNTPITGVLFVMEEVLADWSATAVGSIVLAAVSAVVTMRAFLGNQPLFQIPEFELNNAWELLIYAGIGLAGGALSASFIKIIERVKKRLEEIPHWRFYVLPGCAGLTGVVGLWFPEVMGAGYEAINSALHGQFVPEVLIYLALAKLVVTIIAFTAETPGGMFAPALFVGAMVGGGLGGLAHRFWPLGAAPAEAYMLVGMGTFFAGVFRAPITSIFMVFELSASYVIILPVMIANTASYLLSRRLHPTPFFKMLAQLEGVNLPTAEEKRTFQPLRVEDAMQPVLTPLVDGERSARLYPDEPLDAALRLLSVDSRIEVVSRLEPDEVLGTLTLEDVHKAYGIVTEKVESRTR